MVDCVTHDTYRYRNPLDVVIREELRTCKGCIYRVTIIILGTEYHDCAKHDGRTSRCKDYRNPTEDK